MKTDLIHIGLTVKDFDRTAEFYRKHFGFELEFKIPFDAAFFESKKCLYDLEYGNCAYVGFLRSPNNMVIEIFEFKDEIDSEKPVWNRPGFHHICFWADDISKKCKELEEDGAELYFPPEPKNSQTDEKWVFLKDPDGNLIEINGM